VSPETIGVPLHWWNPPISPTFGVTRPPEDPMAVRHETGAPQFVAGAMTYPSRWYLILGLVIAPVLPLLAQSPTDQAILAQVDASVSPDPLPAFPRTTASNAQQLQAGLEELSRFLRDGNRTVLERALFRFNQVTAREPTWAWPEYAMAHAFLLLHDLAAPVIQSEGGRDGEPHLDAMWRHLLEALRRDPTMYRARLLLADLSYPSGDRELRRETREALAAEVSQREPMADALVVWGRHQRANKAYDLALRIFERAEQAGADPSVTALERARTLAALQQPESAAAAYWSGVARLTPRGRDLYRQDLGYVIDSDSMVAFDSVPTGGEFAWFQRFWGERDAAAAANVDTRIREHLRRWAYVHELYRIPAPWRRNIYTRVDIAFDFVADACVGNATPFYERLPIHPPALPGDLRFRESFLDHRALIYMRHGEPFGRTLPPLVVADTANDFSPSAPPPSGLVDPPDREITRLLESLENVESWVYWLEGAWRAYHFRGSNALGQHSATTLSSYLPVQSYQAWAALAQILPAYAPAVAEMERRQASPMTCRKHVRPAVEQMRADAVVGIESDSDTPRILSPWRSVFRSFALGSARDASGRVLLSFALPVTDLVADTLADGTVVWPVDFRLVAFRPSDGRRVDLDTTRRFTAAAVPVDGQLSGHFELPLGDGEWQLAVTAHQYGVTSRGGYALRRGLVVGGNAQLSLGDIVTGLEGQPAWRAPDGPFPLNTLGTWVEGSTVELWYEVRGLTDGEGYRTTIELIPRGRSLGEPIRVAADDGASGAITRVRKAIGLDRLQPGVYRLVVTVEAGGNRAVREQDILIVERP
jgi:tetratricopeptide (TPR) repeat protein